MQGSQLLCGQKSSPGHAHRPARCRIELVEVRLKSNPVVVPSHTVRCCGNLVDVARIPKLLSNIQGCAIGRDAIAHNLSFIVEDVAV